MNHRRVITAARSCLGAPFRHGGRTMLGMDCYGPIALAAVIAGVEFTDEVNYPANPSGEVLLAPLRRHGIEVPVSEAGPGMVATFWVDPANRVPQHVGLLTDKGLLHCWTQSGKVVEHELTAGWRRRMTHAFRFPGVT